MNNIIVVTWEEFKEVGAELITEKYKQLILDMDKQAAFEVAILLAKFIGDFGEILFEDKSKILETR